jgi:hypothetical protein
MIFATNVHNIPEIKKALLKYYPKPKIVKPVLASTQVNPNPSLIGYSFEIFFKIFSNSRKSFESLFTNEISQVNQNILIISKRNQDCRQFSDDSVSYTLGKEYKNFTSFMMSQKPGSENLFKKVDGVNFFSKKAHQKIYLDFSDWMLLKKDKICIDVSMTVVDIDSLNIFYGKIIETFKREVVKFWDSKRITKCFIRSLIYFTNISSQRFSITHPVRIFEQINQIIFYLRPMISCCIKKVKKIDGKIIYKPKLHSFSIMATPDLLFKNEILELKTSKIILTLDDYLQVLIYLIFAQTSRNKAEYGIMKKASLYYALFNYTFTIELSEIKHHLQEVMSMFSKVELEIVKEPSKVIFKIQQRRSK